MPRRRLGLLADADEADGNVQFLRNGEHHTALGGAVELGDDQAGNADALVKLNGLGHRVLPDGPIQNQQYFVRGTGVEAREHALHLLELIHEMRLGMEPAGGVGNQHIDVPRAGCLQGVEYDRGRLGAGLLRNDRHPIAFGPDRELFARGRAKGISRGQHDRASLGEQPMCQLADGGGFARTVDAHHQDHVRLDRRVDQQRSFDRRQDLDHRLAQGAEQRVHIVELLARHAAAQFIEDARRRFHPDIRRDQARFQVVEDLRIDLAAGQQFLDVRGEPCRTHVQLGAQALEEAADAGLVGFIRHRREA
jgi:hypothetical protein